jgi:hypothetical protein
MKHLLLFLFSSLCGSYSPNFHIWWFFSWCQPFGNGIDQYTIVTLLVNNGKYALDFDILNCDNWLYLTLMEFKYWLLIKEEVERFVSQLVFFYHAVFNIAFLEMDGVYKFGSSPKNISCYLSFSKSKRTLLLNIFSNSRWFVYCLVSCITVMYFVSLSRVTTKNKWIT